jgi:ABC-type multidrug transport system fused ATPase/permease subunit
MSGSILIDGVDISHLTRQRLRSHITTITQDAVALPGSVRTNLRPLLSAEPSASDSDEAIRAALLRVGLLDHVESRGGLDADLSAMQFSGGQMQLFCLARTVLHNAITKSHVILIDEATSNMDRETEERAQQIFQSFSAAGCTMIVIAHRTDTIQDADVIIELAHGKVINIVKRGA